MKLERSRVLFEEAQRYLPGGVNSPVRAYQAVGGHPPFIIKGAGARIYDADGNEYIDYVGSWGPLILGHAPEAVIKALSEALANGTSFGAPTERETTLAKLVCQAVPSVEMVRFVNSGTEATMSALRLARAATKRRKIVKFTGGYHGHVDALLPSSGSGVATLGLQDDTNETGDTLTAPYNDIEAVERLFRQAGEGIAAVIIEPVAANMGVVAPVPGFLEGLRRITAEYGALLIFDEVITGFRAAYGGAQELFGIRPDITCLGKIIGGGLPVGAYGGRRELMEMVAPQGPVYQAGTLSGNPLAMTAGIATLRALQQPGIYQRLEALGAWLESGINTAAAEANIPLTVARFGSLLTIFFNNKKVQDYDSAAASNRDTFASFFRQLLQRGVYWPPSQFEAAFVSLAHDEETISDTIKSIREALRAIRNSTAHHTVL